VPRTEIKCYLYHKLGHYASECRRMKKGTRKCIDENKSENCAFIMSRRLKDKQCEKSREREVCFRITSKK